MVPVANWWSLGRSKRGSNMEPYLKFQLVEPSNIFPLLFSHFTFYYAINIILFCGKEKIPTIILLTLTPLLATLLPF